MHFQSIAVGELISRLENNIAATLFNTQHAGTVIESVSSLGSPQKNSLSYVRDASFLTAETLPSSSARFAALVVPPLDSIESLAQAFPETALIICERPDVFFAYATQELLADDQSSYVDPKASVDATAVLGEGVKIEAGAFVGARVKIGAGTVIHANAVIYHDCELGESCIIHSNAVIGADGLGFPFYQGKWVKQPHIGRVILGNEVEVGASTAIDRATLDATVIENGVKLDNHVHIAHNCRIGAYSIFAAKAAVAGSTTIGRYCQIGGGSVINEHITLTDGVVINPGSGVAKSIDVAGRYSGFPVQAHEEWKRNAIVSLRLYQNFQSLRKKISALKS